MFLRQIKCVSGLTLIAACVAGCGAAVDSEESLSAEDLAGMADEAPEVDSQGEALSLTNRINLHEFEGILTLGDLTPGGVVLGAPSVGLGPIFVQCSGSSDGAASQNACERGTGSDKGTWQTAKGYCDCGDSSACQQNMINVGGSCT